MSNVDLYPKEAEDIVIGQVLFEPGCIARAATMIKAEHFYGPEHRTTFSAAMDLWREGTPVDLITMTHKLRKDGSLDLVGGPWQLVEWTRKVARTSNLEYHALIIREQFSLRTLRDTGLKLGTVNITDDTDEIIGSVTAQLGKAASSDIQDDVDAAERAFALSNEARPKPWYLGMESLDQKVFILPGNVVTISAPSGVGKTAFALCAAINLSQQLRPWFVSLEMSADELITRAKCQFAAVDIANALEGRMEPQEEEKMAMVAGHDFFKKLIIHDGGDMTIDDFRAKAEHKVRNEGVGLIVLDYAQLMEADRKRYPNEASQNEAISKGIRATARNLNVPILLVVHLNRLGEAHGSTQYEKDAHVRLKLSREIGKNVMEVDVVKNRNGSTGPLNTPCIMRYGLVGKSYLPAMNLNKNVPDPNNRIEPTRTDDAPF
jgi:replicative DNA helicase